MTPANYYAQDEYSSIYAYSPGKVRREKDNKKPPQLQGLLIRAGLA